MDYIAVYSRVGCRVIHCSTNISCHIETFLEPSQLEMAIDNMYTDVSSLAPKLSYHSSKIER